MIFQPKLFSTLKNYNRQQFYADLKAGAIVAVVALPLAIAFGIASGVTPQKGLYSAIIAGFICSMLGGSRVQISGPTGAFIIIVYGVIQQFGMVGLAIATILAGIMLIAMGFLKLGTIIKFIPYPVIVGFTSGIALTIFATQIKDFFGLQIDNVPVDFIQKWGVYFQNFHTINFWAVGIGLVTILIIAFMQKFFKKIPGLLIAIIVVTLIAYFLKTFLDIQSIETIGDRFFIDPSLPKAEAPAINFEAIQTLLPTAFTIAMLCAIVSLLSATVADGALGDKHDSNTELIAQGIANIITPIFGGIPSMGAVARTMTNINNGGRTPVAGMVHAVVLLLIVVFLGGLTKHIPVACLAGVLIVVSYNMSDWRSFRSLVKNSSADAAVLLTTFVLTVAFSLTLAIEIGLLLAVVLFIKRISETSKVAVFKNEVGKDEYVEGSVDSEQLVLPKGIEVYEIEGPFFFGIATKFDDVMKRIGDKPNVRIIRMRKVPFIDSTGLHNLESLIKGSQKEGIHMLLSGVNESVHTSLKKSGIEKIIGADNVCSNINEAVDRAIKINNEENKA